MFSSKNKPRLTHVGPPVEYAPRRERTSAAHPRRLLVVNWNVHVGHGDVITLIDHLDRKERDLGFGSPEFVLLLQEMFRRGEHVPDPGWSRVPRRILPPATGVDVVDLAERLDWWMYYVPSMRNGSQVGSHAEDRGNAILSSLPLSALHSVELPLGIQPRVALIGTVNEPAGNPLFRVAVAHLDTRAPLHRGWVLGGPAARKRQAETIVNAIERLEDDRLPLILGGDLNTHLGDREGAVHAVARIVDRRHHGSEATHTSGLILDYVFARLPESWRDAQCERLHDTFGSDHFPLVLPLGPLA